MPETNVYDALARCTCGHLIALHKLSDGGERKGCSASGCPCKKAEAA